MIYFKTDTQTELHCRLQNLSTASLAQGYYMRETDRPRLGVYSHISMGQTSLPWNGTWLCLLNASPDIALLKENFL